MCGFVEMNKIIYLKSLTDKIKSEKIKYIISILFSFISSFIVCYCFNLPIFNPLSSIKDTVITFIIGGFVYEMAKKLLGDNISFYGKKE
jgi:undecaprenyl pyrophosphate phosphatase UppP